MVVYIVQVMNNTSRTLHYHNLESDKKIDIQPKTVRYENNGWIPCSKYYKDAVPYKATNHINVRLNNGPTAEISDDRWKFGIVGPVSYTNTREEYRVGDLKSGGQYMMRVDEIHDGRETNVGFTFYEYEDKYKVTATYITLQLIQQLGPVVALVLMAIFL
ncbi:hypothetical protein BD410DRAFT_899300 [Rickenella mellea]|uniref:Uncharacterized protein n=1 Tax=Rickenella mellea TaxID=50990 RepID=A0A4Y7Q1R9_9AGAM|nr:hypothetical protein BD410DRAFT_899300 [Rickenella mellea]